MVDEVTSHNKEIMPLCVRFVDTHKDIQEEFIQFSTLTRVTGEAIAARVCSDLADLGLDIKNIRGQGYVQLSCWSTGTYKGKSTTSHLYPLQWTLFEPGHQSLKQFTHNTKCFG